VFYKFTLIVGKKTREKGDKKGRKETKKKKREKGDKKRGKERAYLKREG
jgi:hypothetical protein